MKTYSFHLLLIGAVLATPFVSSSNLHAVEGALGRPVSGAGINPYAGVVPPEPGWMFALNETWYHADIGGGTAVPVAGRITLDLETTISFTPFTVLYNWKMPKESTWNLASGLTVPLAWVEAEAEIFAGPISILSHDEDFGIFDLMFTPVMSGWQVNQTTHVNFSLNIWAPTGDYDVGSMANLGLNNWTFIPTISFTKIFPKQDIELSASWGLQFYTENEDTHYQNGEVSDLEFLVLKRLKDGFGFGVVGSWIEQISDDTGSGVLVSLDGFRGSASGIGPIITWKAESSGTDVDFNLRWVHELDADNRFKGDTLLFGGTWRL